MQGEAVMCVSQQCGMNEGAGNWSTTQALGRALVRQPSDFPGETATFWTSFQNVREHFSVP